MYPDDQNQQNPYEFITNPGQPPRKSRLRIPGSRNPLVNKLILLVVGLVVIAILVAVAVSFLTRGNRVNIEGLVGIAQTQQELVRIAQQGSQHGSQPSVQNLSINVRLGVETNRLELTDYLKEHGRKVGTKELNLKKSDTTDAQLTNAIKTSTFDSVYVQVVQSALVAYNTELEQATAGATGENEKKLLDKASAAANLLLQQVPSQESVQAGS